MHRRIIQAVRKEKAGDRGFHLLNSEARIRYKLLEKVEGKLITFYLEDISPIKLESL